jgi:hypothetical protein
MAHGRRASSWALVAEIMAQQANIYRKEDAAAISADDINPYSENKRSLQSADSRITVTPEELIRLAARALCPGRDNFPKNPDPAARTPHGPHG